MPTTGWIIIAALALMLALTMLVVVGQFVNLYIQALLSNAPVRMVDLIGMKLRKVDIRAIVLSRIRAVKAGLDIPTSALEQNYLAGGHVANVVSAIIAARAAKIDLPWDTARVIDLAGRDILAVVHTSVTPKVIDCPAQDGLRSTIDAVARDGTRLRAKARVTVRTSIDRLVGGATEETLIPRICESIAAAIESSPTHREVLADPRLISGAVMAEGLDAGTAFEILAIDLQVRRA